MEAGTSEGAGRLAALTGAPIPIIGAPMTFIANAELASAVSEAGGLGLIETTSPQGRADLTRVRHLTDRPVGANIALVMRRDPSIVEEVHDASIRFVTTSSGDPNLLTGRFHDAGITVFHVVGTLAAARKAVDAGVDGLIIEGVEGGGFKSKTGASTMVLLPLVADHVDVPIVAAGGICDARSMAAALVLGADGVQVGTRMLASDESPVHPNVTAAIIDSSETATTLLSQGGRRAMRILDLPRTPDADAAHAQEPAGKDALRRVESLYFDGDLQCSVLNCGQVAGRIDTTEPVAAIMQEMWTGVQEVLTRSLRRIAASPATSASSH
ncbi:NAD(P)H-dependent flavin oxidoreductase [Mycolicibacterium thermoresistibile]